MVSTTEKVDDAVLVGVTFVSKYNFVPTTIDSNPLLYPIALIDPITVSVVVSIIPIESV